jgi:uncharacterized protein YjbI with pentapeptide repeats
VALVVVASVGMVFGVAKEIEGIRSENERTQRLQAIYAKVNGVRQTTTDPTQVAQLTNIADQVYAAASHSRRSEFSRSDFSQSDFSYGNFTEASFRGALFRDADLRGVLTDTGS